MKQENITLEEELGMFLQEWENTAFGTDYGMDSLEFLEKIVESPLRLEHIYRYSNLQEILAKELTSTVNLFFYHNENFEQHVHIEEFIIALSAVVLESQFLGESNLKFKITDEELRLLHDALEQIFTHYEAFTLFEMLDEKSCQMVLNDVDDMLNKFRILLGN